MSRHRHLEWSGCFNVRDLGGLRTTSGGLTRWGAVVRADNIAGLTEDGWRSLRAHGVQTIIDLRNDDEVAADTAAPPRDLTTVRIPLDDVEDTGLWDFIRDNELDGTPLYYRPFLDRKSERCAAVIAAIADAAPGGVVVHCSVGRDRTGLIALLLLALAGVAHDDIVTDYAMSADRLPARYAALGMEDQNAMIAEVLGRKNTSVRGIPSRSARLAGRPRLSGAKRSRRHHAAVASRPHAVERRRGRFRRDSQARSATMAAMSGFGYCLEHRHLVLALCLVGCGRVGYEPVSDDGSSLGEASEFAATLAGSQAVRLNGIGVDRNGNVYVAGGYDGDVTVAPGRTLPSIGPENMYVASFSQAGAYRWAHGYGGIMFVDARDMAVRSDGTSYAAGLLIKESSFQGIDIDAGNSQGVLLAIHDADGDLVSVDLFAGKGGNAQGRGIAVNARGDIAISGLYGGDVDFGGGLLGPAENERGFAASFNPDVSHNWSRAYAGNGEIFGNGAAVDSSGNSCFAGRFDVTTDFGGGPIDPVGNDAYLACYDQSGGFRWAARITSPSGDIAFSAAALSDGSFVVAGKSAGDVDFGGLSGAAGARRRRCLRGPLQRQRQPRLGKGARRPRLRQQRGALRGQLGRHLRGRTIHRIRRLCRHRPR